MSLVEKDPRTHKGNGTASVRISRKWGQLKQNLIKAFKALIQCDETVYWIFIGIGVEKSWTIGTIGDLGQLETQIIRK